MSMPRITITYAVLLILLGVGTYGAAVAGWTNSNPSVTALIPAFAGIPFLIFGVLSITMPNARKHLMHAAAALSLLLALAGLGMGIKSLVGAGFVPANLTRPLATAAQLAMGVFSVGFLVRCIKSFRDARKAREAGVA